MSPPVIVGIVFLVLVVLGIITLRSYVKAPVNRAYIRTGGLFPVGRPLVVLNGGAWVFKVIHEITWVDLSSVAIDIECANGNALLTTDSQRVDVKFVFYLKVNPTLEGICDAARTIEAKHVDTNAIKQLVKPKLEGALYDVAAVFTLENLHQERDDFIHELQSRLTFDLQENGLLVESVSIVMFRPIQQDF